MRTYDREGEGVTISERGDEILSVTRDHWKKKMESASALFTQFKRMMDVTNE
jgi:hypothetical protein